MHVPSLTGAENKILQGLSSPEKIQDFLDSLAMNHEKNGETCQSPREVLRTQKAHCLEGALLGACALWIHGARPLLMNLKTTRGDDDHAVALFKINGYWGALSKTNHPVLRYRDPIYKTTRELALSYFHEYFLYKNGKKTLRGYSKPFSLYAYDTAWVSSEKPLWHIADALAKSPHFPLIPQGNERKIRPATSFERASMEVVEWKHNHPRT